MGHHPPMNVEQAVDARAERHRINETQPRAALADVVQLPRKSVRRLTPTALLEELFKKTSYTFHCECVPLRRLVVLRDSSVDHPFTRTHGQDVKGQVRKKRLIAHPERVL